MNTEAKLNARRAREIAKMDWVNIKTEISTCKNGTQYFLVNGLPHREDGPAIIYPRSNTAVWMYRGDEITPEVMPPKMLAAYRQWTKEHGI